MYNDTNEQKAPEKKEIDLEDKTSVKYWKEHLSCSEAELRDAVESVGRAPGQVIAYIRLVRGERTSGS